MDLTLTEKEKYIKSKINISKQFKFEQCPIRWQGRDQVLSWDKSLKYTYKSNNYNINPSSVNIPYNCCLVTNREKTVRSHIYPDIEFVKHINSIYTAENLDGKLTNLDNTNSIDVGGRLENDIIPYLICDSEIVKRQFPHNVLFMYCRLSPNDPPKNKDQNESHTCNEELRIDIEDQMFKFIKCRKKISSLILTRKNLKSKSKDVFEIDRKMGILKEKSNDLRERIIELKQLYDRIEKDDSSLEYTSTDDKIDTDISSDSSNDLTSISHVSISSLDSDTPIKWEISNTLPDTTVGIAYVANISYEDIENIFNKIRILQIPLKRDIIYDYPRKLSVKHIDQIGQSDHILAIHFRDRVKIIPSNIIVNPTDDYDSTIMYRHNKPSMFVSKSGKIFQVTTNGNSYNIKQIDK